MSKKVSTEDKDKALHIAVVSGSFDLVKLKKLFGNIYIEGYYDRDWKIDQDSADEKSEKLAVEKMLDKCRV
jgi:hypothetical protein